MADFYLNKVEPVVLQAVSRITADNVVHTMDGNDMHLRADNDKEKKHQPPEDEEEQVEEELSEDQVKEEVVKLNTAAKKADFKFYFAYNPKNKQLCIDVVDLKTKHIIRSFGQSEITEMLKRLVVKSGVLVDYKG